MYFCRIILETDANTIAGKVATNAVDGSVPFSEQVITLSILSHSFRGCIWLLIPVTCSAQTISQALATAREHLARSLLK